MSPSRKGLAAGVLVLVVAGCGQSAPAPDAADTSPEPPSPAAVAAPVRPAAPPASPEQVAMEAAPVPATPEQAAPPAPAPTPPAPAAVVEALAPPAAFARCAGCHSAERGAGHKTGPNLFGVMGAKAGSRPGYTYSDAMAAADFTWTAENLDAFLANPREVAPGTKMMLSVADAEARRSIIAYLSELN